MKAPHANQRLSTRQYYRNKNHFFSNLLGIQKIIPPTTLRFNRNEFLPFVSITPFFSQSVADILWPVVPVAFDSLACYSNSLYRSFACKLCSHIHTFNTYKNHTDKRKKSTATATVFACAKYIYKMVA